jgi:anaerobic selenocysteine-containing dehydrogenase
MWECRSDEEVFLELAKRFGLDYGADTIEDILNKQLEGLSTKGIEAINFSQLKEKGYLAATMQYEKYKKNGFATPSGKMELYSSILEKYGYDPLPNFQEPPESFLSTPELAKEYPLILTTGGRVQCYFHSEYRQVPSPAEITP